MSLPNPPLRERIKRGSTLQCDSVFTTQNASGLQEPVDLTGWLIKSQVRNQRYGHELLADATITLHDQATRPGEFTIGFSTAGFPLGPVVWDIRYEFDGGSSGSQVIYTETVELEIEQEVTQP